MLKINCPNGSLQYPKKYITDNLFLKDSLFDKCLANNTENNELFLPFDIKIINRLIPFIREGIIYNNFDDEYSNYNHENYGIDYTEFTKLIEYISISNIICNELLLILENGMMNEFGQIIKNNRIESGIIDMKKYPNIMHFDNDISKERINKTNILFNNILKKFINTKCYYRINIISIDDEDFDIYEITENEEDDEDEIFDISDGIGIKTELSTILMNDDNIDIQYKKCKNFNSRYNRCNEIITIIIEELDNKINYQES